MMLPTRTRSSRSRKRGQRPRPLPDREWLFPRDDCVLLPIENTTAELLARYIAGKRLLEDLKRLTTASARRAARRGRGEPRAVGGP